MMGGGVDYSFEAIGRVDVMRAALKRGHKGWGECTVIGVAGVRPWRVKGRSPLPGMVDEWLAGKFSVDPYITHNMTHDWINTAFDLLHREEVIRSVMYYHPRETLSNDLLGSILTDL